MMLGVAVGVAVLSSVIAISQGTSERVKEIVQDHNLDMIMVRAGGDVQVFAPTADRGLSTLFPEDARAIEKEISNVDLVSVTQNKRGVKLVHEDRSAVTRAFGVDPSFAEIRHRPLIAGEFISNTDMSSRGRVRSGSLPSSLSMRRGRSPGPRPRSLMPMSCESVQANPLPPVLPPKPSGSGEAPQPTASFLPPEKLSS